MSDDWARKCAEAHNQELQKKQQRDKDAQARRDYVEQGASAKFQEIRERVEQDLRTLREASVTFATLGIQEFSGRKFVVGHRNPWIELSVEFHMAMIKCECRFSPTGDTAKDVSKTLRICSDLTGNLTVHENGDGKGKEFADLSEISHFILRPAIEALSAEALK